MSIVFYVSAIGVSFFACAIGAFGMRFFFERKREIAEREDPRDTQIRDLQATLAVVRKDAATKKTAAEDSTNHLGFAHDRIEELLKLGKDTNEKLESVKELLRATIIQREELHDKLTTTQKEVDRLKEQLQEAELELSMSSDDNNMLDPTVQSSGQTAIQKADAERMKLHEKLSQAEEEVASLEARLQEAEQKISGSPPAPDQLSNAEKTEVENKLSSAQEKLTLLESKLSVAQKEAEGRVSAAEAKLADADDQVSAAAAKLADADDRVAAAAAKLADADDRVSAAEAKLVNADDRVAAAAAKVADAQGRVSVAEREGSEKLSATEGKLSATLTRLSEVEGKLITLKKTAQEKFAAIQTEAKLKLTDAQSRLSVVMGKLSSAERKLAAAEYEARGKIVAVDEDMQQKLAAAEEQVAALKIKLRDAEEELNTYVDTNAMTLPAFTVPEQETGQISDPPNSGHDESHKMYKSTVEDGSPSLIECLTEELDRWRRHCHVLGDELKQHREQVAREPVPIPEAESIPEPEAAAEPEAAPEPAAEPEAAAKPVFAEEPEPAAEPAPDAVRESTHEPVQAEESVDAKDHDTPDGNGADVADELTDIRGIGKVIAGKLHELGIYRYEQLASLTEKDVERANSLLPDFERRMRRYDWMEQARTLHNSKQA